jgi:hypothetical protein
MQGVPLRTTAVLFQWLGQPGERSQQVSLVQEPGAVGHLQTDQPVLRFTFCFLRLAGGRLGQGTVLFRVLAGGFGSEALLLRLLPSSLGSGALLIRLLPGLDGLIPGGLGMAPLRCFSEPEHRHPSKGCDYHEDQGRGEAGG